MLSKLRAEGAGIQYQRMSYLKHLKQSRGQALVEGALFAPLIVFFLFTVLWFAGVMLTWQQISTAARYGTDLITYTSFSGEYIESDIRDYLCNVKTIGRILNSDRLDIRIEINDYESAEYNFDISDIVEATPGRIFNAVMKLTPKLSKSSVVEIRYLYKIPKIFKILGREFIELKARSEVLSGVGSQRVLKRQR
jgi:hypothetical protein